MLSLYAQNVVFYSFMSMLITDCLDSFCTIFTLSDFFVNVSQKLFPRNNFVTFSSSNSLRLSIFGHGLPKVIS